MEPQRQQLALRACGEALRAGLRCLREGGSALAASQAAVRVLEEDPACNAGRGSVLTSAGSVEVDAAIMDGASLGFGAVAAMANCGNGVDVARAILNDGRYVLLVGQGAWDFAKSHGVHPRDDLIVERARRRFERDAGGAERLEPGTVGACAIDGQGHVAAATSTGGTSFKPPGRVGDTPLPGCGTYADDELGAASATGLGEGIARVLMTRRCCELMARVSCPEAAWQSVRILENRVQGAGGLIAISREGKPGVAQNTELMPFGIGRLQAQGEGAEPREQVAVAIRIEPGVDPLSLLT